MEKTRYENYIDEINYLERALLLKLLCNDNKSNDNFDLFNQDSNTFKVLDNLDNNDQEIQKNNVINIDYQIKMFTREEVGEILHIHTNTVSILREVGILDAIKVGKNYLFPRVTITNFIKDYIGLDCSNREKAIESKKIVDARKVREEN